MDKNSEKINLLLLKLENLLLRQQGFESEINMLKEDVNSLRSSGSATIIYPEQISPEIIPQSNSKLIFPPKSSPPASVNKVEQPFIPINTKSNFKQNFNQSSFIKSDLEKFIGENLISKIGILILIIGVAIGAKYAIDKDILSPLTRIILGYLVGIGLMGFALKLKAKYENFSAVLLSGSIAIMYFLTYAAYDFYSLIPQELTFALMVIFTSFTVFAAVKYNQQVIAHIGLVGAYGVPFLLSDGSGNVAVLFTYITIINIGILILSFKKYWKPLFYLSFALAWLIFASWLFIDFKNDIHFKLALTFSIVFFLIFYSTNLAYKLHKNEVFGMTDVIILLLNSFIYYGIGFYILRGNKIGIEYLGLYTLINAIIHFLVSLIIFKRKLANKNLFYFILAMVITFITMAIPVQLSGNWVTIFWVIEATVLYYLGISKNINIYLKLSFPLIFLAVISLLQDWTVNNSEFNYFGDYTIITPFFNIVFLTGLIFIICFVFMLYMSRKNKNEINIDVFTTSLVRILKYAIPSILLAVTYYSFRLEIANIFRNLFETTKINSSGNLKSNYFEYNWDYKNLKIVTVLIYSLFFAALLTIINLNKIKSKELSISNALINTFAIVIFLLQGLFILSELRVLYITQNNPYFTSGNINVLIRYVAILFYGLLILTSYHLVKADFFKPKIKKAFYYLLFTSMLWILSSELLHWLQLKELSDGYKLGLSILWGSYSLFLIIIGLWKNKKYIRISAIVLFGITLIKLFLYDISSLDTISKTIVFVSLGLLLLIISFLYNKYKHLIIDEVKIEN